MTKVAASTKVAHKAKNIAKTKKLPIEAEKIVATGEAELAAGKSEKIAAAEKQASAASAAPVAQTAMIADAATFSTMLQDAAGAAPAASGSDDSSGLNPLYIAGGVALVGGLAAVALGGGEKNVAPTVAATQAVSTDEDKAATVTVAATDANNDTLTYTASAPANGTVTVSGGTLTYTPKANFSGTDTFTVTVADAKGLTATQTVTVTVKAVNDAPTVTATQAVAATEDAKDVAFTVAGADVDTGDTLTYSAPAASAKGGTVAGGAGGKFTYTPAADFNGTDTVVVTVKDAAGATATQTVTFTVAANVNETLSIDVTDDSVATAYDANGSGLTLGDKFKFTDDSAKKTNAVISNFANGDTIEVTGASSDYAFTTVGTDLQITYNNTTAGVVNKIVVKGVVDGFISDEASAESVLGWDFFKALTNATGGGTGTAGAGNSLDADNDGNVLTTAIISASTGDVAFTEDANVANTVRLTGFAKGDTITASNATSTTYSFGSVGTDITITANKNGVVSTITLADANPTGAFISSEASAEAVVGSDFFKIASAPAPTNSQAIDNGSTKATFDASTAGINFTDDASKETNAFITGFTSNDRITVTGATSGQYSFGTSAADSNDLEITFNNTSAAVTNVIVLNDVLVGKNAFIFDYATAQAALGFDFMVFA